MLKIEMKKLTTEGLIGMREINNQELEEVSGGTSWCDGMPAQGSCYNNCFPFTPGWIKFKN